MSFDIQAKDWDNDPVKTERAKIFADEIKKIINSEATKGFEFGCGTGLLCFELKDVFKQITLADTSSGMIEVLKEKIEKSGMVRFKPLLIDIFNNENLSGDYDAVFTMMTLHHIQEPESAFIKFNQLLREGGHIFIADLVTEDGSFHSNHPDFDGHNGFSREELLQWIGHNGFQLVEYKIFFTIEKHDRKYPLFMLAAKKVKSK